MTLYMMEQACFIDCVCAQCTNEKCFQSVAELSAVQKHYEGVRKTDYSHPTTLLNSFPLTCFSCPDFCFGPNLSVLSPLFAGLWFYILMDVAIFILLYHDLARKT